MKNNWKSDLEFEKEMMPKADLYYKNVWGAHNILRYNWGDPYGKAMQKKDIDCTVYLEEPSGFIYSKNISEKFRRVNYGDILVELRNGTNSGWGLTSEAQGLCYFVPGTCYEINMSDLKTFLNNFNSMYSLKIDTIFRRHIILYENRKLNVWKIESENNSRVWTNTSVTLTPEDLRHFNIRFREKSF